MSDHISASQINRFLDEPALWIIERLYGVRGNAGPKAWRGTACEAAMDAVLFENANDADALKAAMARFEQESGGEIRDDILEAAEGIPAYLANLLPVARKIAAEKGKPLIRQARIELDLPGIKARVIGYVDYLWDDAGMDLKTTARAPSFTDNGRIKDKAEHLRQVAIYAQAKGRPFSLLYATPTKNKPAIPYMVSDEECATAMRQVMAAAKAMDNLLAKAADRDRLAAFYPPRDLDSYVWSPETIAKAREIWNL